MMLEGQDNDKNWKMKQVPGSSFIFSVNATSGFMLSEGSLALL